MKLPEIKNFRLAQSKNNQDLSDVQYTTQESIEEILQNPDRVFLQLLINEYIRNSINFIFDKSYISKTSNGKIYFGFQDPVATEEKGTFTFTNLSTDKAFVFENHHRREFPIGTGNGTKHLKLIESLFETVKNDAKLPLIILFTRIENQQSTQDWLRKNKYSFTKRQDELTGQDKLIGIKKF